MGIRGTGGSLGTRVVGAVLERGPTAKSGCDGVGTGREPVRSWAMCTLRRLGGSGLGGGGCILSQLPECLIVGLDMVRLRECLVSWLGVSENPLGSLSFQSVVTLEGEPSRPQSSARVKVTTGRSGLGPISLVLTCTERAGEVLLPHVALAASELTRVRARCAASNAAPEEFALVRGILAKSG